MIDEMASGDEDSELRARFPDLDTSLNDNAFDELADPAEFGKGLTDE
jgi:hypothetical protein